jgi:hypothetical protein
MEIYKGTHKKKKKKRKKEKKDPRKYIRVGWSNPV